MDQVRGAIALGANIWLHNLAALIAGLLVAPICCLPSRSSSNGKRWAVEFLQAFLSQVTRNPEVIWSQSVLFADHPSIHSYRRATNGLTRDARSAGIAHAASVTTASVAITSANVPTSLTFTPNTRLDTACPRAMATTNPQPIPIAETLAPSNSVMRSTPFGVAPSAIRTPI